MGIGKWFARKGNVGGTARAVAKGWLSIKEQNPEMSPNDIAAAYINIRYGATGEKDLADTVLYSYDVCPVELAWSILKAENKDEIDVLYKNEKPWKEIMREEIEKLGLDPDGPKPKESPFAYLSDKYKKPPNKSIREVGASIADIILDITVNAGELLAEKFDNSYNTKDGPRNEAKMWEITIEFQCLIIILLERKASKFLDKQRLQQFINVVVETVGERTIEAALLGPENEKVKVLMKGYFHHLHKKSKQYGKYKKILHKNGNTPEGTMLYEFGNTMADIIGSKDKADIRNVCSALTLKSWDMMKLEDEFKKIT
jgi:hypothetical protein